MTNALVFESNEILMLPVDKISPNPYQPRRIFERTAMSELASSIKEFGVMQPISVRLINGCKYELVAGERRLRACKLIGLSNIPAVIVGINDRESALLALIENIQRESLNYFEEAEGIKNLIHDYNYTQEKLSQKLGKSQSAIANRLRLLRLQPEIQQTLLENGCSERHARALLRLPDSKRQKEVLARIIKDDLTVRRTEELIESILSPSTAQKADGKPQKHIKRFFRDTKIFTNTIKQAVGMMIDSGMQAEYEIDESPGGMVVSIMLTYPVK